MSQDQRFRIEVNYCLPWNYLSRAVRVAEDLLGTTSTASTGSPSPRGRTALASGQGKASSTVRSPISSG